MKKTQPLQEMNKLNKQITSSLYVRYQFNRSTDDRGKESLKDKMISKQYGNGLAKFRLLEVPFFKIMQKKMQKKQQQNKQTKNNAFIYFQK